MATDHPMLDVRFFRIPRFSAANLAITLAFLAMVGSMFVLTLFMQFVLGFSPLEAGILRCRGGYRRDRAGHRCRHKGHRGG